MNESKFEQFILKRTNNDVPFSWDLLHETCRQVVIEIVEDEDQSPLKEWGQFGWYANRKCNAREDTLGW